MPVLLITSDRPGVGKTAMAGAIAGELLEAEKTVAYFKPCSSDPGSDPDVAYFRGQLPDGTDGSQPLLPTEGGEFQEAQLQSIGSAVEQLSAKAQVVLVEAPSLTGPGGETSSWSVSLEQMLNAKVLVVLGFRPGFGAQTAQQVCSPFEEHPPSVVINLVPQYRLRQLTVDLASNGVLQGTSLLGAIPTDRTMASVTVQQIAEHVNGQWVVGQEGAGMLVENLLIGGNIMDSGETYFGRHDNKAVLVRGDRPDIQLACLNTNISCLVLTGGFTPNQYVFHEAERRDVPLLVVNSSTVATAEALDEALGMPLVHHPAKIQRFRELMKENVDVGFLMGMF